MHWARRADSALTHYFCALHQNKRWLPPCSRVPTGLSSANGFA